jgi:hypothetical protein
MTRSERILLWIREHITPDVYIAVMVTLDVLNNIFHVL